MNYIIVFIIAALIDAGTTYAVVLPSAGDGQQQVTLKAT